MSKAEIDKIRDYVSMVWPYKDMEYIKEIVELLVSNNYTTLDAVKKITNNKHLMLYGGKLPMRFRHLIDYNN